MCRIFPCSFRVTRAPTESSSGTAGVGPVELVERDLLEPQPAQAALAGLDQVLGPAVDRPLAGARALQAALGRDHEVIRVRVQGLADSAPR